MLDLHRRGILLAIASKNNPEDALRAPSSHPEMLRAAANTSPPCGSNWNDKAASLREIAAELNVGVDSLAFLDDNPAERQRIRLELPEVAVIELPEDPLGYARALRDCPLFERLALSAEDGRNGRATTPGSGSATPRARRRASLEEFYHSLEQTVEIAPVTPATLARAAQLTHKTNQFNLTTRRYTEAQLSALAGEPDCRVYTVRVQDRFGDNGIVGLCVTRDRGDACEIESFLLSCRVIGRTVETAVLAFLIEQARARGRRTLAGWFLPTRKNAPAAEFYPFPRLHPREGSRRRRVLGAGLWRRLASRARRGSNWPRPRP